MVVILYDGYELKIDKDEYLLNMYDEFLLMEYGETLESNEDYIPYQLGEYTYIVVKEEEYNNMTDEDLTNVMKLLNNC